MALPIEPVGSSYRMLTAEQARRQGYLDLAAWLDRVQVEWAQRRGAKAEAHTALEWLDYSRKLTGQNPQAAYRVLYPSSGTYLCASVEPQHPIFFESAGQSVSATGFAVDHVTYHLETSNENEANFLAAVLNAPITDQLLKPLQARGQWGPRHLHKKVLELPIPQYDERRPEHGRLAALGQVCSEKVAAWLAAGGPGRTQSIGR
ncbi:MAG: hypothetical protein AB1791_09855, partial [Chloroflexota bacterium]